MHANRGRHRLPRLDVARQRQRVEHDRRRRMRGWRRDEADHDGQREEPGEEW
jgi:hypothetical protein